MTEDLQSCLMKTYDSAIPAHLQPSLAQIVFPHPAYLDLPMFRVMRAKASTLQRRRLKDSTFLTSRDVYTEGIVMSRSKFSNNQGNEQP